MRSILLLLALVACTKGEPHTESSAPAPPETTPRRQVEPDARFPIASEEVTFTLGERTIPGTLTRPARDGAWPAVVLLAGSGPTDRDWNSPLLPSDNGSGKLLAEELAKHGAVALRFDKAGTGGNPGPGITAIDLDVFRDEARAALGYLRGRPEVDPTRLFVAGSSEGGLHATRVAQAEGPAIAGVIQLAGPGRTMKDVVLEQLEGNFRDGAGMTPLQIDQQMLPLRRGFDDFLAGRDVDPTTMSDIPQVQQLFASMFAPISAKLVRGLFGFDNAAELATVDVPVLIVNGGKDMQVSPEEDAGALADRLRKAGKRVTLHISPDADHVLKHQPLPVETLRADLYAVQNGYNAPDRTLDPDVVRAIVTWLGDRTR